MEKINNNIVAKIIFSIIAVAIMGVLVYFMYIHYDNLAKENSKKKEEQKEETINPDDTQEKIELNFEEYDLKRKSIIIASKNFVLSLLNTDAGNLLQIDDEVITDISRTDKVNLANFKDYLIVFVEGNENRLFFINKEKEIISIEDSYSLKNKLPFSYIISSSLFTNDKEIVVNNNKICVTFTAPIEGNKLTLKNGNKISLTDLYKYNIKEDQTIEYKVYIDTELNIKEELTNYTFKSYIEK